MSLIKKILKKTAGVGLMIVGAPLGAVGFGASIPTYVKTRNLKDDLMDLNNQSKLVCVLSEKLSSELSQLNSTTFDLGDYVTSSLEEDKQQRYERIYDYVVNSFGELETVKLISKEEFVNYMLNNGEELENYINSEEFYKKLMELKNIVQDETKTPEERLYTLKESINTDKAIFDAQYRKYNKIQICAIVFMAIQSFSTLGGMALLGVTESMLDGLVGLFLGLLSRLGCEILTKDNIL